MTTAGRRSLAVEDRELAKRVGSRLRAARVRAGLTQQQLAEGRYTKAYVSALENGLIKPSMAALNFLAERLGTTAGALLTEERSGWTRIEADLRLAAGDWRAAADAYTSLLEGVSDQGQRGELLLGLAEALCRLDRPSEVITAAAEAASIFAARNRATDAALARYWLAGAHHQSDNTPQARELLHSLLAEVGAGLDVAPDFHIRLLLAAATVENHAGEHQRALTYLNEARGVADELDDRRRATFLYSLALSYRGGGDLEAAVRTGLQSLALFRAAEAESEIASIENELALIYLDLGDLAHARQYAREAHEQFEQLGDDRWLAHVLGTEAEVELAAGNLEGAEHFADEARVVAGRVGNANAEFGALLTLAKSARQRGRLDDAVDFYEHAAALARRMGPPARLRAVLSEWAEVLADQGDLAGAYRLSREALSA